MTLTLSGCLVAPSISTPSCGSTIKNTQWERIYCEAVTGATAYKFKMFDGTNEFIVNRTVNYVHYFDFMPNWSYGNTYDISAQALVNGVWTAFGTPCAISITPTPKTELTPTFCNTTLTSVSQNFHFKQIDYAVGYIVYIKNMDTGITHTSPRTGNNAESRRVRISDYPNAAHGTTFKVWADTTIDGTNYFTVGENDTESCTVTTPTIIPTTQLQRCGTTLPGFNVILRASWRSDLVQEWHVVRVDDQNNALGEVYSTNNYAVLSQFGVLIQPGTAYKFKVRLKILGIWGNYGTTCTITTPGVAPNSPILLNLNEGFEESISVYPNPFNNEFSIMLPTSDGANIQLFDINGRLIENRQVQDEYEITMGQNLNTGVYLVRVEQNGETQSFKLIKK
jgi:hypothetical protein